MGNWDSPSISTTHLEAPHSLLLYCSLIKPASPLPQSCLPTWPAPALPRWAQHSLTDPKLSSVAYFSPALEWIHLFLHSIGSFRKAGASGRQRVRFHWLAYRTAHVTCFPDPFPLSQSQDCHSFPKPALLTITFALWDAPSSNKEAILPQ